jgi:hypothetical protein
MQLKIVKYSIDDLIVDLKEVSHSLNNLCSKRAIKWCVTGIIQQRDDIILALDQCSSLSCDYLFAEINKNSVGSIEEEIKSHWQSGIFLMGTIQLTEQEHVGLFRREH